MSDEELPPGPLEPPADPTPPGQHASILSGPFEQAPRPRSPAVALTVAVLVAGLAAGTVLVVRSGTKSASLDAKVPKTAVAFVEAQVRPAGEQRDAARSLLSRVPAAQREEATKQIEKGLQRAFAKAGLDYKADVRPWVGDRVAVAVLAPTGKTEPRVVVLAASKDDDAARKGLAKTTKANVVTNVDAGVAYVAPNKATLDAFKKNLADEGPLTTNTTYSTAIDELGDGLVRGWYDAHSLKGLAGTNNLGVGIPGFASSVNSSGSFVFRATDDGLEVVAHALGDEAPPIRGGLPALLESSSAGLTGALTVFDPAGLFAQIRKAAGGLLGARAKAIATANGESTGTIETRTEFPFLSDNPLAQLGLSLDKDVLPWLHGEVSVVMGGFSAPPIPDIGMLIQPTDKAAAARTIAKLRAGLGAIGKSGGFSVSPTANGFVLNFDGVKVPVVRYADRVVIASSLAYAKTLSKADAQELGDDTVYRKVFGADSGGVTQELYLRVDRIRSFVETFLPAQARSGYESGAKPFVDQVKAIGMRATVSGRQGTFILRILVE